MRGAFPPFDEQAAIACILDAVDTAIEQTREAVERARTLDHSLLHDLLEHGLGEGRSDKRPVHWEIKRVSEIAEVGSGVTMGKDVSGFKSVELPYLRVANVQDGHLDLSTIKTVRVRCDEVDHYRLKAGDVLMTEGGDLDKLGRGTLWEGQIPDCLHQNHIFRVRVNRKVLDPRFFSYVVESDIAKRYFIRVAKRTTNLASTNKTQVRAFRFPVPPLPEQQQIVAIVAAAKAKLQALMQKEVALQQLKNPSCTTCSPARCGLVIVAFRRCHEPQELTALLDRLRAEPRESEWLEFKANHFESHLLGEYVSALANSACLLGRPRAYLVFGIEDGAHAVIGTKFDPAAETAKDKGRQGQAVVAAMVIAASATQHRP